MKNIELTLTGQMTGLGADTAGIILATGITISLICLAIAHVLRSRK